MRLFVCEKKTQVQKIAEFFNLKYDAKENVAKGKIYGIDSVVVPLAGHIMRLYKPEEYVPELQGMSWQTAVEKGYYPFIPKIFKKKVKTKEEGKQFVKEGNRLKAIYTDYPKYYKIVKKYAMKANEIIASPDPDTEGFALFREVIAHIGVLNKVKGYVRLNKLEKKAVLKALKEVVRDNHHNVMADAGEARGEYDWLFGINLSVGAKVFLTKNRVTLHVGAVKTPTLRLVVERDKEIENFNPETFYGIKFTVEKEGKTFSVTAGIKEKDKSKTEELKKYIDKNIEHLTVDEFKKEKKQKLPPLPFTLTELASTVKKRYGIPIEKTMQIAQKLYEGEYQTYPRSDCNYYSSEMFEESPEIVKNLFINNSEYEKFEYIIDTKRKSKAFNDKEVDKKSHTALGPTLKYPKNIDETSFKVYDTVVRRFLAQFAPSMEYYSVRGKASFEKDGEKIFGKFGAISVINKGFTEIEPVSSGESQEEIPLLSKGDKLKIIKTEVTSHTTKPKPRFTDNSLLDAMERIARFYDDPLIKEKLKENGIGTQATRIGIITSLIKEGYLEKKKNGVLVSSEKGRKLIEYLPEEVSNPVLRAKLEEDLDAILENKINRKQFLEKNKRIIFELFDKIKEKGKSVLIIRKNPKPTKKMINFAKNIAKKLGIKIDKDTLENFEKTQKFILDNLEKVKNSNSIPKKEKNTFSQAQKDVIEKNAPEEIKKMLDNEKENYEKIKKWLDAFFESLKNKKYELSPKQKRLILKNESRFSAKIKKLAQKESLTKNEYNKVREAIDEFFSTHK